MWWSRWKREEGEKAESETVFKEDGGQVRICSREMEINIKINQLNYKIMPLD